MFDLAGIAKVVAGVCLAALWVVVLLTHRYLRKLQRERPELIAQVGMISVDWWIGCLRGMFLGLHRHGRGSANIQKVVAENSVSGISTIRYCRRRLYAVGIQRPWAVKGCR